MARILLIDDDAASRLAIRGGLAAAGHDVLEADASQDGYALAREELPDAVVLNMNLTDGHARQVCQRLHKSERTHGIPILALAESHSLDDAEELFALGASATVPRPLNLKRIISQLERLCQQEEGGEEHASRLGAPDELRAVFEKLPPERSGRLGDMAEIFSGLSVRDPSFRRMAPPSDQWVQVIGQDAVRPFVIEEEESFVRFDRVGLLRVPGREEFDVPQKVVLARAAPPVSAAVDRSGTPIAAGVYSIIPAKGLTCGYLACLLCSRLMDFYFNRIRPLSSAPNGGLLRVVDVESVPIVVPEKAVQNRLGQIERELAMLPGAPTNNSARVRRATLMGHLNEGIFTVYGMDDALVHRLGELHF